MRIDPVAVSPVVVVHQEGVIGLVALVAVAASRSDPVSSFAAVRPLHHGLLTGSAVGVGLAVALWAVRGMPPLRELERWQRALVGSWSPAEAVAVAALSGLAEEALLRAFLQPLSGILIAALVFSLLHLIPDRRLWAWPAMAFLLGIVFGLLFQGYGYPACAASHAVVNLAGLLRLRTVPR